jgi:uncharacterized protein (DUF362 family)
MKTLTELKDKSIFIALGIASLVWFILRVVPKPSRAMYPCQRAAFPIAATFVSWLVGLGLFSILKKKLAKTPYKIIALPALLLLMGILLLVHPQVDAIANKRDAQEAFNSLPAVSRISFENDTEKTILPRAFVSIIKSDKEDAVDITEEEIFDMVSDAISEEGNLLNRISDGMNIVIKPNIVCIRDFSNAPVNVPAEVNGMTTDWRVIKALVQLIRTKNESGKVYVMEGSGVGRTRSNFTHMKYTHENIPGVTEFIAFEDRSGEWEEWDSDSMVKVQLPEDKMLYPTTAQPDNSENYYLNKIYANCDFLISVPVLKNHEMTSVTGAVKNIGIGSTPANIYGGNAYSNLRLENNRIDHSNRTNLHKFIHDYYLCRPADYVLMDGLQGSENGPAAERKASLYAARKNARLILASSDAVAIDAIASLLMGYDPLQVNHLVYLHNDTAGCVDPLYIRTNVDYLQSLKEKYNHFSSTGPQYTDFDPVSFNTVTVDYSQDSIIINIDSDDEIERVDIEVDGALYAKSFINNAERISIPLEELNVSDSIVRVIMYDQYLNSNIYNTHGNITTVKSNIDKAMKLYPNPTADELHIQMEDISTPLQASIYSIDGKIKYQNEVIPVNNTFSLNTSHLEKGTFVLQLKGDNTAYSSQFMKSN